jgi:hypothetical protein
MRTSENPQVPTGPSKLWLAVCAGLCVAILAFGLSGARSNYGDLAYEFGYNLPIAAVLAGVLHLAFRRRGPPSTGWIGFALVYGSLIATALVAHHRQKQEIRQAAAEVQQTLSAVQAAASAGTSLPPPLPVTGTGNTEAARVGIVMKTMVNRMLAQRREYELELDSIGWGKILDGQRLRSDATLAESRAMLQRARDAVAKYKSATPDLFSMARRDIEVADLSSSTKQSMLAGFDKSLNP